MNRQTFEHLLGSIQADIARLVTGRRADGTTGLTLPEIHDLLGQWSGLGWPAGGGSSSRGSDVSRPPEQIVVAGAFDIHGADRLELEVSLKLAADSLRWLTACVARNTPTKRNPEDRPTASCLDCGRTVAATAFDPIKAGRCTFSKDEPEVGCYGAWERRRKAQQRARDVAEFVEGIG